MRILFLPYLPGNAADTEHIARREAVLNSYASAGTEVHYRFPDDFPGSNIVTDPLERQITPGLVHIFCTAGVVSKIVWAQENGYDAVVQSNTFDAAVEAARQAVHIPVVGVTRASLHLGASLTDAIGMTVPLETHVNYASQIVRSYHMESIVKAIRPIGVYENADQRKDEIISRTVEVMRSIVDDTRAGCLIPLGGALIPQLVSPEEVEKEVGVPVLNTNAIGIRFAEMCVNLGLSHVSKTHPSLPLTYAAFTKARG